MVKIVILLAVMAISVAGAERPRLRWWAAGANCAAQAADAWTTWRASNLGYREANPILAIRGAPRWPVIAPIKAAVCGVGLWRASRGSRSAEAVSFAIAGATGAIAATNYIRTPRR